MRISPLLLLFFCLLYFPAQAQLLLGWNGGYANPRELNREIYLYNQVNKPNLKNTMNSVHWYQGPVLGYRLQDEQVFFELLYVRRRALVSSEFDSSAVAMKRQMKVQSNTLNLGFGYVHNGWLLGISMDVGSFKGKGRRGTTDAVKKQSWERLWVHDSNILLRAEGGFSFFIERQLGRCGLRLYYEYQMMRLDLDNLDGWMFGANGVINYKNYNTEHFSNLGLQLTLQLGKK